MAPTASPGLQLRPHPACRRQPLLSPARSCSAATWSLYESKASGRVGNSNFPFRRSARGVYFLRFYAWYLLERLHEEQRLRVPTGGEGGWGRAPALGRCFPSGCGEQAANLPATCLRIPSLGPGTLAGHASVRERLPSCPAARAGLPMPETAPASASQGGGATRAGWPLF